MKLAVLAALAGSAAAFAPAQQVRLDTVLRWQRSLYCVVSFRLIFSPSFSWMFPCSLLLSGCPLDGSFRQP